MVIQGDSLYQMWSLAQRTALLAKGCANNELLELTTELCELLSGRVAHYDEVLRSCGMEPPARPSDTR